LGVGSGKRRAVSNSWEPLGTGWASSWQPDVVDRMGRKLIGASRVVGADWEGRTTTPSGIWGQGKATGQLAQCRRLEDSED
jgi:hypothetical protein